ncbi:type II toxin-antitoxin system HipA family toxin [uncultured Pseudomonas sp.]|uniref:type II toxin-antitoxin system HipA family toxin n=1 Tax=uncultured Pseudomonas sp. TaxID=114707 RepID=UPI0025EF24F2|nr:type II toxin-antitoxin system HipA family toxin [uncultured Pseudomonas sp.]
MTEELAVWRDQQRIGTLWTGEDGRTLGFRYVPGTPRAISNSLPLTAQSFAPKDEVAHHWFANLLPEEMARQALVSRLGVADEDFALLGAIGGDCAGALRIVAPDTPEPTGAARLALDPAELARWAEGKERYAPFHPQQPLRLSLAGAQDKLPVIRADGALFLPLGSEASSHLLKFARKPALIYNELYMNRLAQRAGLPVPATSIGRAGKACYLEVARYDRRQTPLEVERLHQEDFCQALGYPRRLKYQEEGGPSLADCTALLRRVATMPGLQVRQLLRWQLFNVLAGNSDGHAKNLSLLQDADGRWELAPAYDLVCTRVLPYSPHLGFAVGSNFHPQELRKSDWHALAQAMGLAPPFVLRELKAMLEVLESAAHSEELKTELLAAGLDESGWIQLQHLRKYVVQQCRRYRSL